MLSLGGVVMRLSRTGLNPPGFGRTDQKTPGNPAWFCAGVYGRRPRSGPLSSARSSCPMRNFPAMLAAVTDATGRVTGIHRTWLDPDAPGEKTPVSSPRRAMGDLLGAGVPFGMVSTNALRILIAGEREREGSSVHPRLCSSAQSAGVWEAASWPSRGASGRQADRAGKGGRRLFSAGGPAVRL
jgi:hypothetical protein